MIEMATVNMTIKLKGMARVASILDVLARIPWVFLPMVVLVGSETTAELVARILVKLFVRLEVAT